MIIETKYEVGTHIWVVYDHYKEACVYDTYIEAISYDAKGLNYITKECNELEEYEIILYEDNETLVSTIKKMMAELNEKEKNNEKI